MGQAGVTLSVLILREQSTCPCLLLASKADSPRSWEGLTWGNAHYAFSGHITESLSALLVREKAMGFISRQHSVLCMTMLNTCAFVCPHPLCGWGVARIPYHDEGYCCVNIRLPVMRAIVSGVLCCRSAANSAITACL